MMGVPSRYSVPECASLAKSSSLVKLPPSRTKVPPGEPPSNEMGMPVGAAGTWFGLLIGPKFRVSVLSSCWAPMMSIEVVSARGASATMVESFRTSRVEPFCNNEILFGALPFRSHVGQRTAHGGDGIDEVRDELVGDGAAQAGDQVIAGACRVAVVAAGFVMEVPGGELVQAGQGLCRAEGSVADGSQALVGDGNQAGPGRCSQARAGDRLDLALIDDRYRAVDVVAIERHIGIGPMAATGDDRIAVMDDKAGLEGGLRLIGQPAPAGIVRAQPDRVGDDCSVGPLGLKDHFDGIAHLDTGKRT